MPGWTGLANARVTIFGDIYQLPAELQVRSTVLQFRLQHAVQQAQDREPTLSEGGHGCIAAHNMYWFACTLVHAHTSPYRILPSVPHPAHSSIFAAQASARDIFVAKHANERKERWVSGNFVYFRMDRIVDIYFVGGFGTVQVGPADRRA